MQCLWGSMTVESVSTLQRCQEGYTVIFLPIGDASEAGVNQLKLRRAPPKLFFYHVALLYQLIDINCSI